MSAAAAIRQESLGALVRRLWQAVARGDAATVADVYAPDAVLRRVGCNPLAGEYKGHAAILAAMAEIGETVDDLQSELLEVLVGDSSAVLRYRMRALCGRHELDGECFLHLRVEGGRIVQAIEVPLDPERNDTFWNAAARPTLRPLPS
jgi:ketosteroid isomerase-like protein